MTSRTTKASALCLVLWIISAGGSRDFLVPGQQRPRRAGPEADFPASFPLKIGDALPNVSGYDSAGKPFPLQNLKGHYTVLVFGCLT